MENDAVLKFELSIEEVNAILAGLGKLPLEASVNTWAKIKQVAEQQLQEQGITIPSQEAPAAE